MPTACGSVCCLRRPATCMHCYIAVLLLHNPGVAVLQSMLGEASYSVVAVLQVSVALQSLK